ncbi:ankyrin repeat protein [Biomphalaria pfeifferi]|uniref:Ankyrin repeat protein n=1 Tax=Biomphalaria pfeifferi TaxID=112525 RepID=A0AAD8FKJ1_BIOPF|nr:ankyrin repeat protein [Biomphalaria pfeifferi]
MAESVSINLGTPPNKKVGASAKDLLTWPYHRIVRLFDNGQKVLIKPEPDSDYSYSKNQRVVKSAKRKQQLENEQNLEKELCAETKTRCQNNGPEDEKLMNAVTMERYKEAEDILSSQTMVCSQEALDRSFMIAAYNGQKLALVLLLNYKANPNWVDKSGNTPLMVCAQNGFLEIVRILIDNGANVNEQNSSGDTALILSITKSGSAEMARLLCTPANVNVKNKDGYTALMKAVDTGDLGTLNVLIFNGANTSDVRDGKTITEMAERNGILKFLNVFIECKASKQPSIIGAVKSRDYSIIETFLTFDKNCVKMRSSNGESALEVLLDLVLSEHNGLSSADKEKCKLLILNGVDVNLNKTKFKVGINQNKGDSPLVKAVQTGDLDLVRWLCFKSADLNEIICFEQLTPLMMAAKEGFVDIACFLLSKQANVEVKGREGTALDIAVKYKKMECAKILLEEKVKRGLLDACKTAIEYKEVCLMEHLHDKFTLDIKEVRLMEWTIESGSKKILNFLISKGADVNSKILKRSPNSSTQALNFVYPLHLCVANENLDLIKELVQSGADVNIVDANGDTPLFHACAKNSLGIINYLLTNGAKINAQNNFGKTPIFVAVEKKQLELVNVLLEHGADINICDEAKDTLVSKAIKCQSSDIVTLLLNRGADTNAITKDGDTILTLLLKTLKNSFEREKGENIFKSSLQQTVDINRKDVHGNTALIIACKPEYTWLGAARLLLEQGADVNIINDRNESALSVTLSKGDLDLTKLLLENKATFHLPAHCQEAVHLFITENRPEIIPLALGQGVYPFLIKPTFSCGHIFHCIHMFGNTDLTPLTLALLEGRSSVVLYLIRTRFLTKFDITDILSKCLSRNTILQKKKSELFKNLLSLTTLSFVQVSDSLGATPDREIKVNQLPLPNKIKEQLLFRNLKVKMESP